MSYTSLPWQMWVKCDLIHKVSFCWPRLFTCSCQMLRNKIFWIEDLILISFSIAAQRRLNTFSESHYKRLRGVSLPLCYVSLQGCAGINPTVVPSLILPVDSLCPASGQRDSCVLLCGGLCSLEQLKAWQLHPMTVQTQSTLGIHIKQSSLQSLLES